MSVVLETGALPERDRKPFWREEVCSTFMCSTPVYRPDETFFGKHDVRFVGSTALMETWTSQYAINRGAAEVSQKPADVAILMRQRSGTRWFTQNSREATLTSGDFILLDSASPMSGDMAGSGALQCIVIPRPLLARRLDGLEGRVARTLTAKSAAGVLLNDYCDMIIRQAETQDESHQRWLENGFHDLVAMLFGADPQGLEGGVATLQTARLQSLVSFIDKNHGDPQLTPESVAAQFGISDRYVHKLFEGSGGSFRQTLVRRRLSAARQCLMDPRQSARSIADIAFSCGFGDLSGFNRSFKSAYGATPRSMRAEMLVQTGGLAPGGERKG